MASDLNKWVAVTSIAGFFLALVAAFGQLAAYTSDRIATKEDLKKIETEVDLKFRGYPVKGEVVSRQEFDKWASPQTMRDEARVRAELATQNEELRRKVQILECGLYEERLHKNRLVAQVNQISAALRAQYKERADKDKGDARQKELRRSTTEAMERASNEIDARTPDFLAIGAEKCTK